MHCNIMSPVFISVCVCGLRTHCRNRKLHQHQADSLLLWLRLSKIEIKLKFKFIGGVQVLLLPIYTMWRSLCNIIKVVWCCAVSLLDRGCDHYCGELYKNIGMLIFFKKMKMLHQTKKISSFFYCFYHAVCLQNVVCFKLFRFIGTK